jgi:Cu+-exporting ATPase
MGSKEFRFRIRGMTCASCVSSVESALGSLPGASGVAVNLATGRARILLPAETSRESIRAAVARAGKEAVFDGIGDPENEARQEFREWMIAAVLALPLMLMLPLPFWLQCAFASMIQFGAGRKFYRGAFQAIKRGSADMDVLVVLGTSAAYGISFFSHHPWFETSAMILVLVRLGKWLELRARIRAARSLRALESLQPSTARVRLGMQSFEMPISAVRVGDRILVLPGERIPADGQIEEGESDLDESLITGESRLLPRGPGDGVRGGSLNTSGALTLKVLAVGGKTLLSKIIAIVESAQDLKPPIQRSVDRVSAVFVPAVLLIGFGVGVVVGVHTGRWEEAILRAVTVLVIACPCALGLATPTALMVGTGLAARSGILIRDLDALEQANRITILALDKTGTLTEGKPRLRSVESTHPDRALRIARALQFGSEHPLARAFLLPAAIEIEEGSDPGIASSLRTLPGRGIEGSLEGETYRLGSDRMLVELGLSLPAGESSGTRSHLVQLGVNPLRLATFIFEDGIKPEAREFIRRVEALGIRPMILTGDRALEAERVAQALGVREIASDLLPEEKALKIRALQESGACVAMLGDGINDAPALAQADVGIALSTGTDVAMQTASLTLLGGDPLKVLDAIALSRATARKIRQNLGWAFVYNLIGIPLAASGLLTPIHAGAAMALSSVSVVSNSLWLGRFGLRKDGEKGKAC